MIDAGLFHWTLSHLLKLLVVMTRVGPLVFLMPVIGNNSVPPQVKALFTLVLSLILVPAVNVSASAMPNSPIGYAVFVGCEVAFAAILSILARLVFDATDLAGQVVSISMGMGMAGTMDPEFGVQVSLVGFLWNLIAILIFLAIDGHHFILRLLVESFDWLHPGTIRLTDATFEGIMKGSTHMFVLGIQIMAPAAVALFFAHVAMGIVAKIVPQIPIMLVAMPVNIALGFTFVLLSMGYLLPLFIKNFNAYSQAMAHLGRGMGG